MLPGGISLLEAHMSSPHLDALDVSRDDLVVLVTILLVIAVAAIAASPWIILLGWGWRSFLNWYLLPYPFVFVCFAIIMVCVHHREMLVRVRNWRTARSQRD